MSVVLTESELGFRFADEADGALSIENIRVTAESGWLLLSVDDRQRTLPSLIPLRIELLRDESGRRLVQIGSPVEQLDPDAARRVVVPALRSEIGRRIARGVGA